MTVKVMAKKAKVDPTAMPTMEPELMGSLWPVAASAVSAVLDGVVVLLGVAIAEVVLV